MNKLIFSLAFVLMVVGFISCVNKSAQDGKTDNNTEQTEDISSGNDKTSESENQASSGATESVKSPVLPSNGLPTVVDFSAVWCGPCQQMKPIFNEFEEVYDGMVNFVTVDIDEYPEYSSKLNVQAVPTFVFLDKDGKEIGRQVGAMPRTELEQAINSLIGK